MGNFPDSRWTTLNQWEVCMHRAAAAAKATSQQRRRSSSSAGGDTAEAVGVRRCRGSDYTVAAVPSGVSEATHCSDDDAAAVSETTQQHRHRAAAMSLREQPHQRMKLGFSSYARHSRGWNPRDVALSRLVTSLSKID